MSRRSERKTRIWRVLGAACGVAVIGCAGATAAGAAAYYKLVQYPGTGFSGFYRQISGARKSIDMEMYELADPAAEQDLAKAARRGVKVRVLLDSDYDGREVNDTAFGYLKAHGVEVKWAPSGYIFHIKATSFDDKVSDISTANLTAKYYRTTRDAEIVDSNPTQVRAIEATFANDWNAAPGGKPSAQTMQAAGLVWSPNTSNGTAETALVAQIQAARKAVDFSSEELSDRTVYDALAQDAKRGVSCRVLMTRSSEWDSAFDVLARAGCQVHTFPDSTTALYIHEKLIIDDPGAADAAMLIGSQNASVTSLTRNRELGIVLTAGGGGAAAIAQASRTFDSDFARATAWAAAPSAPAQTPPTPVPTPTTPGAPTQAGCQPLSGSGNCYEPGEYCSDADHGLNGVAGDGKAIDCDDNDGWRWEPR